MSLEISEENKASKGISNKNKQKNLINSIPFMFFVDLDSSESSMSTPPQSPTKPQIRIPTALLKQTNSPAPSSDEKVNSSSGMCIMPELICMFRERLIYSLIYSIIDSYISVVQLTFIIFEMIRCWYNDIEKKNYSIYHLDLLCIFKRLCSEFVLNT